MKTKKKILSVAAVLGIGALAIGGTSWAYFSDQEAVPNVFTAGNVDIQLNEVFGPGKDGKAVLVPAVRQNGKWENAIPKEVSVKNKGSQDAYVRIQLAIPTAVDDDPRAIMNLLHWNFSKESIEPGKWNWSEDHKTNYNKDAWNSHTETLADGVEYNVYIATYETALKANDVTDLAIYQVYLDPNADEAKIQEVNKAIGTDWKILIKAEAVQAAGFNNAFEAFEKSFDAEGKDWTPWDLTTDVVVTAPVAATE